jgi:site-specific recombinase XerD
MTADSSGTWLAQAYNEETRKQARRSLGSFDDLPPSKQFDAAVAAARAWFEHLDLGGGSEVITVAKACEDYVAHLREHRPRSADDAEARYKRWVYTDRLGKVALPKLTERHVKEWRKGLAAAPVIQRRAKGAVTHRKRSESSLNRDMTALRAALNYAQRSRTVTNDMAWRYALAPVKNADRRREAYLDREQRLALIANAPPDLANFLRGLSMLPLRPGALAALTVHSFDQRLSVLAVGKDKAGRDRKIKLPAATAKFFADQCRLKTPEAPLFSRSDARAWDKDSWKKPLKAAAMAAGLPETVTAYSMRHSSITDLVTAGLDLLTVAQISGTSVLMIERHYGHHRADHAAAALAGLAI